MTGGNKVLTVSTYLNCSCLPDFCIMKIWFSHAKHFTQVIFSASTFAPTFWMHEAIHWFRTITGTTTWWWNQWGSTSASSYYDSWLGTSALLNETWASLALKEGPIFTGKTLKLRLEKTINVSLIYGRLLKTPLNLFLRGVCFFGGVLVVG